MASRNSGFSLANSASFFLRRKGRHEFMTGDYYLLVSRMFKKCARRRLKLGIGPLKRCNNAFGNKFRSTLSAWTSDEEYRDLKHTYIISFYNSSIVCFAMARLYATVSVARNCISQMRLGFLEYHIRISSNSLVFN